MLVPKVALLLVIISCAAHFLAMAMELFAARYLSKSLAGMDLDVAPLKELPKIADGIKSLIWNQGIYNAFLAAGLLLSFWQTPDAAWQTRVFVAGCILIAGLFGAFTVNRKLFVQAALGGVTLLFVVWAGPVVAPGG